MYNFISDFCSNACNVILLIGFPAIIVWFIVSLVKKKNWKNPLKAFGISIIAIIVLSLVGSSAWTKTEGYQEYLAEEEIKAKEEAEKIKEQEDKENLEKEEEVKETPIPTPTQETESTPAYTPEPTKETNTPTPTPMEEAGKDIFADEKWIINSLLIKYNSIAEHPVDDETIDHIEKVGRPLGRFTITYRNGVYMILQYNDFNKTLFMDFQDESYNNLNLYPVIRDWIKAVDGSIPDDNFERAWTELNAGGYGNYYGERYELNKFKITFATRVLNDNRIRYDVKCEYQN